MKYTFDEICESQDFEHDQEFVVYDDYYELKKESESKDAQIKLLEDKMEEVSVYCERLTFHERYTIQNAIRQALAELKKMRKEK